MSSILSTAREKARQWREAQNPPIPGGVVIVFDDLFVGHAAELPPAAQWAAGCLAVAGDGRVHLARPIDFRGSLEWADLGVSDSPPPPEAPDDSSADTNNNTDP